MGQHSQDGFAARALHAPDGETAQAHARIMSMASQTTAAVTGRFVCKLKTQREDESQDKLDECFAIAEQRAVGSFIVEIDGPWCGSLGSVWRCGPCRISLRVAVGMDETW